MSGSGQCYPDDVAIKSQIDFHGDTRDVLVGWLDSDDTPKSLIVESGKY